MKSSLAILGGPQAVDIPKPHYVWPIITEETEAAVVKQLHTDISIYDHSGIIKEFEDRFASLHNRKFGLLTSSGTAALHSMFVAVDVHKGDEVICPAYTFFATVTPLLQTGATPVLCDADPENGNVDPDDIEKLITDKTKAVIVTHMWGRACEMDRIKQICEKHDILLLEDCSHAHGGKYQDIPLGAWGDMAAWSLQGQKIITGGEGGILLTNNEDFYNRGLLLGHYNKRCRQEIDKSSEYFEYAVTGMGLKLRSHPLAVAMANQQLKHLKEWTEQKTEFAKYLIDRLGKLRGIRVPELKAGEDAAWYAFVIRFIPEELEGLSVEKFFEALQAEGCFEADIPGSTCPLNLLPLFQRPEGLFPEYEGVFSYKEGDFPKAEKYFENAIKFPVWIRSEDFALVEAYAVAIEKIVNNYKDLLEG